MNVGRFSHKATDDHVFLAVVVGDVVGVDDRLAQVVARRAQHDGRQGDGKSEGEGLAMQQDGRDQSQYSKNDPQRCGQIQDRGQPGAKYPAACPIYDGHDLHTPGTGRTPD